MERAVWDGNPRRCTPLLAGIMVSGMAEKHVRAALVPEAVLGEVKGVTVVLGALLSTRTGVVIYLYGLPNESTRAWDAEYDAALQEWISDLQAARERGESSPPRDPPTQPGTILTHGMRLKLTDDLGTRYECAGYGAGGTGTEWEATWRFKPGIREEASTVTVTFDPNAGRSEPCTLAL
jgi:hypothetical protein